MEALTAHTEGYRRILDQLAAIKAFDDSQAALRSYADLHHAAPTRELYVFHTSRESLHVVERRWLRIRAAV